jgi:hypothetical protein
MDRRMTESALSWCGSAHRALRSRTDLLAALGALAVIAGCSSPAGTSAPDGGGSDGIAPAASIDAGPLPLGDAAAGPDPMSADALAAIGPCIVSLDCPSGTHCDLGACTQDCSNERPCGPGKVCGPRARCIEQGQVDRDAVPDGGFAGTFSVTPSSVALSPRSSAFHVKVTTRDVAPAAEIPFRVELRGAHLSVAADRGTIKGGTIDIAIAVDPSKVTAPRAEGTITILTPLGNAEVAAPIEMGISGGYHGVLAFDGAGQAQLGNFPFVLALSESNGAIVASADPTRTATLFDARYGAARGAGVVGPGGTVELTLTERVAQDFQPPAGAANAWTGWGSARAAQGPFRRDIAREIVLHLAPSPSADGFEGTFDETDRGLFSTPVAIHGHAFLVRAPGERGVVPSTEPPPAAPPAVDARVFVKPSDLGWTDPTKRTCAEIVCGGAACPTDAASATSLARAVEQKYGLVYYTYVASPSPTGFTAIANACTSSVTATSLSTASACGNIVPLGCALEVAASARPSPTAETYLTFQRLVAEIANPALAAARNHLVVASTESERMGKGAAEERQHYVAAMDVLDRALGWLLQPAVLDYLASTPPTMRGENAFAVSFVSPSGAAVTVPFTTYPAVRAIGNLLYTRSLAALELVRIGAVHPSSPAGLAATQRLNLLTFLEGRALGSIVDAWNTGDASLTARLEGIVQPGARLTSQLLTGANAFGLPEGFVPFIYNPADITHLSNFEQVFAAGDLGMTRLEQSAAAVVADKREFDVQTAALDTAVLNIKSEYDNPLHAACGTDFDPNANPRTIDWSRCGATGGSVAALYQAIDQAASNETAALGVVSADFKKVMIAGTTLATKQGLDRSLIAFTAQNGQKIMLVDFATGVLDAAQQAAQAAASVENPFAMIAVCGVYMAGLAKAHLAVEKDRLELAEKLKILSVGMSKELYDGMASIQTQLVDMAQHNVEVQAKSIAVAQARTDLVNAVANAKVLLQTRTDALALVQNGGIAGPDPSARLVRDQEAVQYLEARANAQRDLYLAAQALQYDVNVPLSADLIADAVFAANTSSRLESMRACLSKVFSDHRFKYGTPVEYRTEISIRKALHITGDVRDTVTGETLTAGQQLRRILLASSNIQSDGSVRISFPTNLLADNGLWSTDLCEDRITNVEAKLVGDSLGDNDVQVNLELSGTNFVRSCEPGEPLRAWSLDARGAGPDPFAVIQGGANTYGPNDPAPGINNSLFGQSVARATWNIELPNRRRAPANADVDVQHIDDIVLRVQHKALPVQSTPSGDLGTSCLFSAIN